MYCIYKVTSNHVIDFAAEELKKYLRMMMPQCGEIEITYAPDARDGFRLGLMSDFGLDVCEAKDILLDDILHIDTDENGGIIAGSNPRSVLLAVYLYLTLNGCRWLFPGIDGERIPVRDIVATKYHKMADCRYRGQCNEGAEYQSNMIEAIDFTPKLGMNIFMIQFDNPKMLYDKYYNHHGNRENRGFESISTEEVLQWKRQCETEISKRGLQFHDIGHGWSAKAFDMDITGGWVKSPESDVPLESRVFLPEVNGERKLFNGVVLSTNFCMSNAEARKKVANAVGDYAELSTNVDYLHVWLADGVHNHCECDVCRKKIPSDWYIMLMNDIDEVLKTRNLSTHIVFICYFDTAWAPETVSLNDPSRFSLLIAPGGRDFTETVNGELVSEGVELSPYELNLSPQPKSVNEYLAHAKLWMERCHVPAFAYEYYFWLAQFRDVGVFDAARIIYDDVRGYYQFGCHGIVEVGSQRSFFPNGFAFYVYASTLFDISIDFEELKRDYFSHAYGEDWRFVADFFDRVGDLIDFRYLNGKKSIDYSMGDYYCPEVAAAWRKIPNLVDEFTPFVEKHRIRSKRAEAVSYKLLHYYLVYLKGISHAMELKAEGRNALAKEEFLDYMKEFGKNELDIERWYDQYLCHAALTRVFFQKPENEPM